MQTAQARGTREELFHSGYLYVMYPPASDAKHVVMRLDIAVIASHFMQERYLARLPCFTKFVENPMDGVQ